MATKRLLTELIELIRTGSPLHESSNIVKYGEENEEEGPSKIDRARSMMKSLITDEDFDRQEVLQNLMAALDVTESTAISYFQRIAKEMGLTNLGDGGGDGGNKRGEIEGDGMTASDQEPMDDTTPQQSNFDNELPEEEVDIPESDDPNRQGVIRVVANAHLVYKRQNEEGTFDELWIYNTEKGMKSDLEVRRDILAGTDIAPKKTRSDDGTQQYRLQNMGNAQLLHILGLPQ
jgi:hypothetical protein